MDAGAPIIDPRDEHDLVSQTEALIHAELSLAGLTWTASAENPDMAYALVRIFARMARHAVESLNRIPDKTFIEFLNLVGAAPRPPSAARVPLTFHLSDRAAADVLVPAGARVAAPPARERTEELYFETESPLIATRARLSAMIVHRPELDLFADRSPPAEESCPLLEVDVPTPHHLLVDGGAIFALPEGTLAEIRIGLPPPAPGVWSELPLAWTYWNGQAWLPLPGASSAVEVDPGTGKRTQVVSFALPAGIALRTEGDREGRFARGALGAALPDASVVPAIDGVSVGATLTASGRSADHGFSGAARLDMSLDHFPFGERPRVGDAFFLASDDVFSRGGAAVTLHVTRSAAAQPLGAADDPTLIWEVWTAAGWLEIGRSDRDDSSLQPLPLGQTNTPYPPGASPYNFADGTLALSSDGAITFTLPGDVAPLSLHGVTSHWLRVRIAQGARVYGLGITVSFVGVNINGTTVNVGSTTDDGFRPPVLASLSIDYTYTPAVSPAALLVENDFRYTDRTADNASGFVPFTHDTGDGTALYLGFDRPFDDRAASLFFEVTPPSPAEISASAQLAASAAGPPVLAWEYASPAGWSDLGVEDETDGLRRAGPVRFIGPADFLRREQFGRSYYWVRVRLVSGGFGVVPRLRCVRTNTVWARHATTQTEEILGSSDGHAHQTFQLQRSPVLEGAQIEVFEPVAPHPGEEAELRRISGDDAVRPVLDDHGHLLGAWVRWQEVTDFYGSGPADRHYVLDHATGEVTFGGRGRGMAPPIGTDNVRAARYHAGGGALGDVAPGEITRLVTTPPLIDGVTNPAAAAGGTDMETSARVRQLGARLLRHGHRAVAADDFEELARAASPLVARARAITPGFFPTDCVYVTPSPPAGQVLVIVVPAGTEARPVPTLALLDDVGDYLRSRAAPAVRLVLSGPDWVRVTASVEVVPISLDAADSVGFAVVTALEEYLHPLTGGAGGQGWEMGAVPRASDLYPLIMAIAEVDHVRKLKLVYEREIADGVWVPHDPDAAGAAGPRGLIFSGAHAVSVHPQEGV